MTVIKLNGLNLAAQVNAATQAVEDAEAQATAAQTARLGAETARTGAEAARDEAEALVLSDLGTTDGQTRALIENPASQTASALSASLESRAFDGYIVDDGGTYKWLRRGYVAQADTNPWAIFEAALTSQDRRSASLLVGRMEAELEAPLELGDSTHIQGIGALMLDQFHEASSQNVQYRPQTVLHFTASSGFVAPNAEGTDYRAHGISLRDLTIAGAGYNVSSYNGIYLRANLLGDVPVNSRTGLSYMRNLYLQDWYMGLNAQTADTLWFLDSHIHDCSIAVQHSGSDGRFVGNTFFYIRGTDPSLQVSGTLNYWAFNEIQAGDGHTAMLVNGNENIIAHNVFEDATTALDIRTDRNTIQGNVFKGGPLPIKDHCIRLGKADGSETPAHNTIVGNTFDSWGATNDGNDSCIVVHPGADRNQIIANTANGGSQAGALASPVIDIKAGATRTTVIGNVLEGGTTPIADAGTSTRALMNTPDTKDNGARRPRVTLYRSASQSINSGSDTNLSWDTESHDADGLHAGGNEFFTVPAQYAGAWSVMGQVTWASNSTGRRIVKITVNGTAVAQTAVNAVSGGSTIIQANAPALVLASGDVVRVQVFQDSGGSLNATSGETATFMSAVYLGA